MPFVTQSDDCKIFYRAEGPLDAPAIILSNSLGCDHLMWQAQADALKHRFRVVRYDQRGHGASDVPDGMYPLERLGGDVIGIADHLGLEKFHFCGLSMGGLTGQWLGVNKGERLHTLILADTSPHFRPSEMWDQRMDMIRQGGMAAISDMVLGRFFTESFHESDPGIISDFRNVLEQADPQGYLGCSAMLKQADIQDDLKKISVPTLVITGRHDQSTPPERGELITEEINGAVHVILDAAHVSNVERPDEFTRLLADFMGSDKLPSDERFASGMKRRRAVLGDDWVEQSIRNRTEFNAEFQDMITRGAWGDIWTRPGLDETTRRMLVLAICASLSRWEEFDLHLAAALRGGVSTDTIREVLMQTAIYAGVPAANTAFARAGKLLASP
jgi:3-oxoadipate enol-lactonase/4-carboxymuconolactone decarboxylase